MISLLRKNRNIIKIVGVDISGKMLSICRKKISRKNLADRVELVHADVCDTKLPGDTFDIVTMAFGIRNMPNVSQVLKEIYRVLKPNGLTIIVELSLPKNPIVRTLYLWYLRYIMPLAAGAISGDFCAYRYLNISIEAFAKKQNLCQKMEKTNFSGVEKHSITAGLADIYSGYKAG